MRTTLTLDEDIAERLQIEARRSGKPFKSVVNDLLRLALSTQRSRQAEPRFVVKPLNMGGPLPGVSLDNIEELLDDIEGPRRR